MDPVDWYCYNQRQKDIKQNKGTRLKQCDVKVVAT